MTLPSDQQAVGTQNLYDTASSTPSSLNKQSNTHLSHTSNTAIHTHNEAGDDDDDKNGTGEAEGNGEGVGDGDEDSLEDKGEENTLLLTDTDFLDILQQVENTDIHTLKQLIANME